MWRAGLLVALASLGLATPGVVLAELQAWAPVLLYAATMAGTALALAGAAFAKAQTNATRLAAVERLTPKRSTDATPIAPPSGVPATPLATGRAAAVDYTTVGSPGEGVAK